MKKQKKPRSFAYHATRLLTPHRRRSLVQCLVRALVNTPPVRFPPDFSMVEKVLVVMPEDAVEGFHQTRNVIHLISLFKGAALTFFCERHASGFFRNMADVSTVIEYDRDERYLFSPAFSKYGRVLAQEGFDVCILLEKEPDLALLQLVARTGATYRIGYHSAAAQSFLNLHVRVSGGRQNRSDGNMALARLIGAGVPKPARWVVSAEAQEEVRHLLRDLKFPSGCPLAGIDGFVFHDLLGREWTSRLIRALSACGDVVLYCIADRHSEPETALWLEQQGLRVVPVQASSRQGALAGFSTLLICGNSLLFQLGQLLHKPTVVLFDRAEIDLFFTPAPNLNAVVYGSAPDEQTVASVCEHAVSLLRPGSGKPSAAQTGRMTV